MHFPIPPPPLCHARSIHPWPHFHESTPQHAQGRSPPPPPFARCPAPFPPPLPPPMPPLGGAVVTAAAAAAKPCTSSTSPPSSSTGTGAGASADAGAGAETGKPPAAVAAALALTLAPGGGGGATATGDLSGELAWAVRPSRKAARTSNPLRNIVDHLKPNPAHGPEKPLLNMSLGGACARAGWCAVCTSYVCICTSATIPTQPPETNDTHNRPHRLWKLAPAAAAPRRRGRAAPQQQQPRRRPARVSVQRGGRRGAAGAGGGALVRERAAGRGRESIICLY